MTWVPQKDGSDSIWSNQPQEGSRLQPPVPVEDNSPSQWVTQTPEGSTMTQRELEATLRAEDFAEQAKGYRDTTVTVSTQVSAAHDDITSRHVVFIGKYAAGGASVVKTADDRRQTGEDRATTQADRAQTGLDRIATGQDRAQTAADRNQTGLDAAATAQDRTQTGLDRQATGQDRTAVASALTDALGARDAAAGFAGAAQTSNEEAYQNALAAIGARDTTLGYRDTAKGYHDQSKIWRDETEQFRNEAQQAAAAIDPTTYWAKTNKITLPASVAESAYLNIPLGVAPATPVDGDIWQVAGGLTVRRGGSSRTIYDSGNLTVVTQADAEAGTSSTSRLWTAQRVRQAVNGTLADIQTRDDLTIRTPSGLAAWQSQTASFAEGWPFNDLGWAVGLSVTHHNAANYYSMQLAASFDQGNAPGLFWRQTGDNGAKKWNRVLDDDLMVGTLHDFAGQPAQVPKGFLICDGRNVSRATYAKLFAAIETTWGAGDGATTFTLPDLRGRGTIGLDSQGGVAAGRVNLDSGFDTKVGAVGGSQYLQAHNHTGSGTTSNNGSHTHTGSGTTSTNGNHAHVTSVGGSFIGGGVGAAAGIVTGGQGYVISETTNTTGNHAHTYSFTTSDNGAHTHTYSFTSSTSGAGASQNMQPSAVVMKLIYAGAY